MGRGKRRGSKKNFADKKKDKQNNENKDTRPQRQHYEDIVRENAAFEKFYKAQKIVSEAEWENFLEKMREPLPAAFRITGSSKTEAQMLSKVIQSAFFTEIINNSKPENGTEEVVSENDPDTEVDNKENVQSSAEKMKPICLPFYPDGLAWQLQLTRKDIRRSEAYFRLHNFLIAETSCGGISRQEVVSMIPPLVLDVKPEHKVLDMCAAPGSKTAQLIEMIHADETNPVPKGFVIANDVDNNRCYMLVHQAKRLSSPNVLITNHDSSVMPNFKVTNPDGSRGILKFDRILADVPCSGDGTLRKNPDIWCKWNPANGHNLHGIQFRIAKRGLEMLAVGGKMVYSTCSLNPMEDEAVVHRLLCETGDSVRLVDGRESVPGLVCNPGLSHWLCASKTADFYDKFEDVPEHLRTLIRPYMFPPKPEDASKFNLDKCIRVLPHHQDTGGFFVAVLEKVKPLPWEKQQQQQEEEEEEVKETEENTDATENGTENETESGKKRVLEGDSKNGPQRKKKRTYGYREDPFVFFKDETEDVWPSIKNFYEITNELDPKCLLVRCKEGKKKNIYLVSPAIRDLVLLNENHVKLINTGVKTFVRCDNKSMKCAFRLAQEGLPNIFNFIGQKRKLKIKKEDLMMMLENNNPVTPPELAKLSEHIRQQAGAIESGSCVIIYESDEPDALILHLVGWKGTMSLRAYLPLHDAVHYLRLLGGDCSKFEKNKFEENRNATKSNESEENSSIVENQEDEVDTDKNVNEQPNEDAAN